MSVFNSENTVKNAVESILNQTYTNFEFLILDDGSQDSTLEIIKSISDKRIKLLTNKQNKGLTYSLNKLIDFSKGKYIARQDADDVSFSQRLEKQIEVLKNTNFKVCTTRALRQHNLKIIPKFYGFQKILINFKNPFIHGTLMIKRDLLIEIGKYNEEFIYAQDYKLFCDLLDCKNKIFTIKEPLYILNMKNNISSEKFADQAYYAKLVRKRIVPSQII